MPVTIVPPTEALVPTVTGVVEKTVDTLLPNLPVEVPSVPLPPIVLPPLEPPPVQVQVPSLPAVVPTPPLTVKLLP